MRKLILIGLMAFISLSLNAQVNKPQPKKEWEEFGGTIYVGKTDTISINLRKVGKDSTSYNNEYVSINGYIYSYIGIDGKISYKPCDSLTELQNWKQYWVYLKTVTKVKGVKISETTPKWTNYMSQSNEPFRTYEYSGRQYPGMTFTSEPRKYYYNKKRVYPIEILTKPIRK